MSNTFIRVVAPSRLHFGMFSFGRCDVPAFGGVGVMIDSPGLVLEFHGSDEFRCQGPLAERAERFAVLAARHWGLPKNVPCEIRIVDAPPLHVGLGTGTQLAMSIAAGLNSFFGRAELDAVELARTVGRAKRSAVGSHGFLRGGIIVDSGRLLDKLSTAANKDTSTQSAIPRLVEHVSLPPEWRFVLLRRRGDSGRHGPAEELAFTQLPPVPKNVTDRLRAIVDEELMPAARSSDFGQFSEAAYEFGRLAGTCFATQQTGAFASRNIAQLVDRLRASGCRGVGQSSWGPTVFALAVDNAEAERIVADVQRHYPPDTLAIDVSGASAHGASIHCNRRHG